MYCNTIYSTNIFSRTSSDFQHVLLRTSAPFCLYRMTVAMLIRKLERENFMTATQAGVNGYIVKPSLGVNTLREVLDKALIKRGSIT